MVEAVLDNGPLQEPLTELREPFLHQTVGTWLLRGSDCFEIGFIGRRVAKHGLVVLLPDFLLVG